MELVYKKPVTKAPQRDAKTGRFLPGYKPWNNGKKGVKVGGVETQFKPGHLPHNTKFDGCISSRYHKKEGYSYLYIRLSSGMWQLYHRYLYEQHNGTIPGGCIVYFKDGNTMNCAIENLGCMSRAENALRNNNRKKASESLKKTWHRTKLRYKIGLPPRTKWGERMERKLTNTHRYETIRS